MNRTVAIALAAATMFAQTSAAQEKERLFTSNDLWWGAAILAGSIALSTQDDAIARRVNDPANRSPSRDNLARNLAKLQEGSLTIGNLALWGIARLTKAHAMADITFHAAEAVVVGSIASQVIRGPLGRSRPHVTNYEDQYDFKPFRGFREFDYRSFPSIHTASAFAVATVYTLETKRRAPGAAWVVGPIAYAIAAGPGLSRIYTGQHWASDILAGAFMGTLAGFKIMKYNHETNPDNRINKFFLGAKNVQVGVGSSSYQAQYRIAF